MFVPSINNSNPEIGRERRVLYDVNISNSVICRNNKGHTHTQKNPTTIKVGARVYSCGDKKYGCNNLEMQSKIQRNDSLQDFSLTQPPPLLQLDLFLADCKLRL